MANSLQDCDWYSEVSCVSCCIENDKHFHLPEDFSTSIAAVRSR